MVWTTGIVDGGKTKIQLNCVHTHNVNSLEIYLVCEQKIYGEFILWWMVYQLKWTQYLILFRPYVTTVFLMVGGNSQLSWNKFCITRWEDCCVR